MKDFHKADYEDENIDGDDADHWRLWSSWKVGLKVIEKSRLLGIEWMSLGTWLRDDWARRFVCA